MPSTWPPNPKKVPGQARVSPEPVCLHNLPPPSGDWVARAACRGLGPAMFFPTRGEDQEPVMTVCDGCAVRVPCAEYGLGGGTLLQGIWGGLNERQRRKRKKERKEAV